MAQESLIRHIFKRGRLSAKYKTNTHSTLSNESYESLILEPLEASDKATSARPDIPDTQRPTQLHHHQNFSRRNVHPSSILYSDRPDNNNKNKNNNNNNATPPTLPSDYVHTTQQPASPLTISTRDLFHAVIHEATTATALHMDTLDTTLALLDAIQGLSATVDILRGEMRKKKKACEGVRRELMSFGEVVSELGLVESNWD
jgi:hypothetical protein